MNQHSSTESSASSSNGSSAEAVSRRAYEIWEREGRPEGCDLRHWLQAEQELGVRHADSRDDATSSGASRFTASNNQARSNPVQTQSSQPARANTKPDSKRASNPPFGNEKNSSGANQSASNQSVKKKPSGAPVM